MTKSLTREILEHLLICVPEATIKAIYTPYGHRLSAIYRDIEQIKCEHDFSDRTRDKISASLTGLRRRGFVKNKGPKKKTIWYITKKGETHFHNTKDVELPSEDGKIRLVIFDIPEKEKRKRNWLRGQLVSCDYNQLQKSVWTGNRPLPKRLLKDIKKLNLVPYIHIVGLD